MRFVTTLALAVALLVVAPYLAHRLRRRRAEERGFAAARLVPPAPPRARRRSELEDKWLFAARALAIVSLALLGASPLVRCSRLSLTREGGASVALAIIVDDSMSMRAKDTSGSRSRFDRAKVGARELLASAREGDAVAVVLAGAPSRVALAATTDLGAARAALDALTESDRATDLEGAMSMAHALVTQLPQVDKRIVVLSDLADGHPDGKPLGEESALPVWIPLTELRGDAPDCAIITADRAGTRIRVKITCSHDASAAGRDVAIKDGDTVVAHAPAVAGVTSELTITLPRDEPHVLVAALAPGDAIASDDAAPVVIEAATPSIAVVDDTADESAATGGAPVVEQALTALRLDVAVRPIPAVPDRAEDLAPFIGVLLDDPPGLTPEQRRAIASFVEAGGAVMVAAGPRAASAPLGASLDPVLRHAVTWQKTTATGASSEGASASLIEAAASLDDLSASNRATLAPDDATSFETLLKWGDGAPLVARRSIGRGEAWIVTLPFAVDASDLTLRPGFLSLLDGWIAAARQHAAPLRSDVGEAWQWSQVKTLTITGPGGAIATQREAGLVRAVPPRAGAYRIVADGKEETRVASPLPREIDLRPRAASKPAESTALGDNHSSVDASPIIAVIVLALIAAELALRARRAAKIEPA